MPAPHRERRQNSCRRISLRRSRAACGSRPELAVAVAGRLGLLGAGLHAARRPPATDPPVQIADRGPAQGETPPTRPAPPSTVASRPRARRRRIRRGGGLPASGRGRGGGGRGGGAPYRRRSERGGAERRRQASAAPASAAARGRRERGRGILLAVLQKSPRIFFVIAKRSLTAL